MVPRTNPPLANIIYLQNLSNPRPSDPITPATGGGVTPLLLYTRYPLAHRIGSPFTTHISYFQKPGFPEARSYLLPFICEDYHATYPWTGQKGTIV